MPRNFLRHVFAGLVGGLALVVGVSAAAMPAPVTLVQRKSGWVLERAGKELFLKGAGIMPGSGPALLAAVPRAGGNSIRTWGVASDTRQLLDEAQRLGLTVCFGLWLEKESAHFSFRNEAQFRAELEAVQRMVLEFKDHPAIVIWGVGNEVEGFKPETQNDPAVWLRIQAVAKLVKHLDPTRPTMTTLAEIGGDKVRHLHRFCPAIDIVGINSYRGLSSLPGRYREAGGTKPYLVTEFGPEGSWEVDCAPWGAPLEPTSTAKAKTYRQGYTATAGRDHPGLCLGSYVFLWGQKQELTATWYGMFLADGSRLEAVDAMTELWGGPPVTDRVPQIAALKWRSRARVASGARMEAVLKASDPEGTELTARWAVRVDSTDINLGGAAESELPEIPGTVITSDAKSAAIRAPAQPGTYRLFVVVKDPAGGAATANLPFLVEAPK